MGLIFRSFQGWKFFWKADTVYQIHSPFVFELAEAILEDKRWYYAFSEIEKFRAQLKKSEVTVSFHDFGSGGAKAGQEERTVSVSSLAIQVASTPAKGRRLFRLAQWLGAKQMLELGTSLGIGSLYLASISRLARLITLEGCPEVAEIASLNFERLNRKNIEVISGAFEQTLPETLPKLSPYDLVFFDGNHRFDPTIEYFEQALNFGHQVTAYVFDDLYYSPEMLRAWEFIQNHPSVTLTVDFFDLGIAFTNTNFLEKQHFQLISKWYKPWKMW